MNAVCHSLEPDIPDRCQVVIIRMLVYDLLEDHLCLVLTSTTSMAASSSGRWPSLKISAVSCQASPGLHFWGEKQEPRQMPIAPGTFRSLAPLPCMKIRSHSESHLVELDDGSEWQIFPGDLDVTLNWRPDTELKLVRIEDPASSHALIADDNGSVRVIPVGDKWPLKEVRQVLKDS